METAPIVVASPFLLDRRAEWGEGFTLRMPADVAEGQRGAIRVIATGGEKFDLGLLDLFPGVRLVACFSTGYEGIDLTELRRRSIALTTAAGVNAHDVADQAIALFLAQWHAIIPGNETVRRGGWRAGMSPRRSLRGRRAGIVGLGRIGSAIASRLAAHEMEVRWWAPRARPDAPWPRMESLHALAEWSDALFIACRSDSNNAGLVDEEAIRALGPDGVLVNVSRGTLVDEAALRSSLKSGRLGGAALDVFAREPLDPADWNGIGNAVLSPHMAGYTQEAGLAMFGQLRENIRRFLAGEELLSPE
ncbi:MAG: hydroxyacid dehydrogenase [Sphingomonadales bacterium 63-6]|nr:MAG: hydroxyacid dehydrogenase [Sphingomonadales bacterium 63-6]